MKFRFTYSHESEGDFVASEPAGFDDAQLGFERDMEFYSLVEFYKAPFSAYGTNGIDNGARDWLKIIEKNYGADCLITVKTEIAPDNYNYQTLYLGTMAISMFVERIDEDHLLDMAFNQKSFWTSFLARQDTPVNIQSPVSLDGESIDVLKEINLLLPSQIIDYDGKYDMPLNSVYLMPGSSFGQDLILVLDWDNILINEIDKFTLSKQTIIGSYPNPVGLFKAQSAGKYRVRFNLVSSFPNFFGSGWDATQTGSHNFDVRVQKTNSTDFLLATKSIETVGSNSFLTSSFDSVIDMAIGEELAIYGVIHEGIMIVDFPYYIFGNTRFVWAVDVDAATTTVVTLSGEQTIDGFATSSSRVLVREQVNPAENGIYVTSAGVWTRASDSNSSSDLLNQAIQILNGSVYSGVYFTQTEIVTTLGVSPIQWAEYSDGYGPIPVFGSTPLEKISPYNGSPFYSFLEITGYTVFAKTTSSSFLVHDVGAMITDRITSNNGSFYSEFLGRTNTLAREYIANGCGSGYMLSKGLQIRQYTLIEKPFFLSFTEWWEGINPILNLGIGYDTVTVNSNNYEDVSLPDTAGWSESGSGSLWYGLDSVNLDNTADVGISLVNSVFKYQSYAFIIGDTYRLTYRHTRNKVFGTDTFMSMRAVTLNGSLANNQNIEEQLSASATTTVFTAITGDEAIAFFAEALGNDLLIDFSLYDVLLEHYIEGSETFEVIRVEPKSFFFDSSSTSVNLSNIQKITRKYDPENQFNNIKAGYQKWQSEDISGIDDPQSVRTWASRFKYIGKQIVKLSGFIAASLAWETTRRTTKIKSADYKFDNDTFIVSVVETGGAFTPELDENFTGVTGLLNEETRYNKRLTVARNFIRHINLINGALQSYLGSVWRFVYGEGNFDMQSTMNSCGDDFNGVPVSEKQDFVVTDDFLFLPVIYEIEHYLTFTQYKLIKANPNMAIGLSLSTTDHKKAFIKSLSVNPVSGDLSLTVWAKEELDLNVQTSPETPGRIFDFSFASEFE